MIHLAPRSLSPTPRDLRNSEPLPPFDFSAADEGGTPVRGYDVEVLIGHHLLGPSQL
jgi:hypothetical protein